MDSPSARSVDDGFDWASALWHEVAHVITLGATDNRVSRWFSEGVSVLEEWQTGPSRFALDDGWPAVPLAFIDAYRQEQLLPVAELDEGFVRPSYTGQVGVSYVQAGLLCEYVASARGQEALAALLVAYRDGANTAGAVRQALAIEPEALDAAFLDYLAARFDGVDAAAYRMALTQAHEAAAAGNWRLAADAARRAIASVPHVVVERSPYPLLARALRQLGERDAAIDALVTYWQAGGRGTGPLTRLADWLADANRDAEALAVLEALALVSPLHAEHRAHFGDLLWPRAAPTKRWPNTPPMPLCNRTTRLAPTSAWPRLGTPRATFERLGAISCRRWKSPRASPTRLRCCWRLATLNSEISQPAREPRHDRARRTHLRACRSAGGGLPRHHGRHQGGAWPYRSGPGGDHRRTADRRADRRPLSSYGIAGHGQDADGVRTLAHALGLDFKRIQFTPDLMPADVTGTDILDEDPGAGGRRWRFEPGPIFTQVLLADEINRTPPKTQAALLEAMQEHRVTMRGKTYRLDAPFVVLATQNPIELEGTYPLPEAQLDRFVFNVVLDYLDADEEVAVVDRNVRGVVAEDVAPRTNADAILAFQRLVREVPVADAITRHAVELVRATRPDGADAPAQVRQYLRYGASVRAAITLCLGARARALLAGRYHVVADDVRALAGPVLRHRLQRNYVAESDGVSVDDLIAELAR